MQKYWIVKMLSASWSRIAQFFAGGAAGADYQHPIVQAFDGFAAGAGLQSGEKLSARLVLRAAGLTRSQQNRALLRNELRYHDRIQPWDMANGHLTVA